MASYGIFFFSPQMLVGGGRGGVGMGFTKLADGHYADWLNKFKWLSKWTKLP